MSAHRIMLCIIRQKSAAERAARRLDLWWGYREDRFDVERFRPVFFEAERFRVDFLADERLVDDRLAPAFFALERFLGTFAPFSRASERPMAIACLRLVTFLPLPLLSVPFLRRRIALSTRLPAAFPYFRRPDDFFAAIRHAPVKGNERDAGGATTVPVVSAGIEPWED